MRRLAVALERFLFESTSDSWLAVLRLGLGIQVTLYCLSLRSDWLRLYSATASSFISRELSEAILSADTTLTPRLGWIVHVFGLVGCNEVVTLTLVWLCLLVAALCLIAGAYTRIAAVVGWLIYLCAAKSGMMTSYGIDNFTIIGLFYLVIAPLPDSWSLDKRLRKMSGADPRLVGFHRRVLQLHLCIVYFFGGLTKSLGPDWWNGESIWRALTRAPFDLIPAEQLARFAAIFPLLGISVCVLETAYPLFIWPKRMRSFWLSGIIAMHVSIALTMGLYLFGLIMIVLNVAAFATDLKLPFRVEDLRSTREVAT